MDDDLYDQLVRTLKEEFQAKMDALIAVREMSRNMRSGQPLLAPQKPQQATIPMVVFGPRDLMGAIKSVLGNMPPAFTWREVSAALRSNGSAEFTEQSLKHALQRAARTGVIKVVTPGKGAMPSLYCVK